MERKYATPDIAVEQRVRPILHAPGQAVLDRIEVTVFDMPRVIGVVANQMLPETSLPDTALVARFADG
jgi:hypothetical protein